MKNDCQILSDADAASNLVRFPENGSAQPNTTTDIAGRLELAQERRRSAHEKTKQRDVELARLQAQYVVCAEPAGIWDQYESKLLREQGFKLRHRIPKFKPSGGGRKRSIADIFLDDPGTSRCSYLTFRPGKPEIDGDHLNLWARPDITAVDGDITPFLDHMDYVYDGEQEAIEYTLNWMALPLQKLGTKMESAVLIVGKQGTGKTILGQILRELHGHSNTGKIKGEELTSQFNDFMMRSTVVCVEEVCLKGKWELMDKIKDTITSTKTRINLKHVSPYEINNVTNFILFSNHSNALAISEGDRRWHVHVSHQPPKPREYYEQLHTWLEEENGYSIIYHHLMHRNLSNFNRHSKPPLTQCKKDMTFASKSLIEQKIIDDIQDYVGIFASDLVTQEQVTKKYNPNMADTRKEAQIRNIMHEVAANTGKRVRVKEKKIHNPLDKGEFTEAMWRIWSVRNHQKWKEATPDEIRAELKKAHPEIILAE